MSDHTLSPRNDKIDDMPEYWVPLKGFETVYEISNHGRIRTIIKRRAWPRGHILRPQKDRFGYYRYVLTSAEGESIGRMAHCLMYEHFVGEIPEDQEIDHIDDDKGNNRIDNLQTLTHRQNTKKAWGKDRRKRAPRGTEFKSAKLDDDKVREIRRLYREGVKVREIAAQFGISHVNVIHIGKGRIWTHVFDQLPMFQETK